MGVQPPFLYDPPSRYSFGGPTERGFDPRAATRASWTPPAPKPKPNGPLISFNQHPDSFLQVPYGNVNATPMSPNTKSKVKYMRKLQLLLRVLALLGSLCLLFCIIAIKGVSGSLGWIIRVAPGVALVHTVYAVFHLARDSAARTPGSSASYMLFAVTLDAGLVPFLGFSAVMARNEYTSSMYGWDTLFEDDKITWYIKYSFFLLCTIEAGILAVSLMIGIYLAVIFRKIDKLPPDMNPLEPNLTARPHKRNKSEMTVSDKHMSQTSLVSENRMSNPTEPLIVPGRRVPFMHTRTDSAESMPFYKNSSARNSQATLAPSDGFYQQSNNSFHGPHSQFRSGPNPPSRPASIVSPPTATRQAGSGLGHRPMRSSQLVANDVWKMNSAPIRGVSPLEPAQQKEILTRYSRGPHVNDENLPPAVSPVSSRSSSPSPDRGAGYKEVKNWYESPRPEHKGSEDDYAPVNQLSPAHIKNTHVPNSHNRKGSLYDFERDLPSPAASPQPVTVIDKLLAGPQNPLTMHPPSPALPLDPTTAPVDDSTGYTLHDPPLRRKPVSRPSSFLGSGTKGKYYGDLRPSVSVGSVTTSTTDHSSVYIMSRNGSLESHIEILGSDSDREDQNEKLDTFDKVGGLRQATRQASQATLQTADLVAERESQPRKSHDESLGLMSSLGLSLGLRSPSPAFANDDDRKGRVVSNTASNISYGYAGLPREFGVGMGRRREVSGKVVEEGRGGGGEVLEEKKEVGKPVVSLGGVGGGSRGKGFAAAGWARFRGL